MFRKLLAALILFTASAASAETITSKQNRVKKIMQDASIPSVAVPILHAAIVNVLYYDTAVELLAAEPTEGLIGYALDTNAFYLRVASAWVAFAGSGGLLGSNGGTFGNETNNAWRLFENSEDLVLTAGTNLWTFSSATGATVAFTPASSFTGAMSPDGGISTTIANGANAACTTTCSAKACITGFDAGASAFVACGTATADTCLCGP